MLRGPDPSGRDAPKSCTTLPEALTAVRGPRIPGPSTGAETMAARLHSPALPVSDFEGDPLVKMMPTSPGRACSPVFIRSPLNVFALFAACCDRLVRAALKPLQSVPALDTRTLGRNPGTTQGPPLVQPFQDQADGLYLRDHDRTKSSCGNCLSRETRIENGRIQK